MHAKRLFITLAAAAVILGAVLPVRADGPAAAHPTAVAVVDVSRLLMSLDEKRQDDADLGTRQAKLQDEDKKKTKELSDLEDDLKVLAPGSPDAVKKQREIQAKVIAIQVWRQVETAELQNDNSLYNANRYRKMLMAIAQVAKDDKYDLVLFKEQEPDFHGIKPENLATAINTAIQIRKVLYAASDLDITDQVITQMNNSFHNAAKPATPAVP